MIVQKNENGEGNLVIQKREESGRANSKGHIKVEAVAIERIQIESQDLRRTHKKRQNWIRMR
jgi:hypothetical protein